jgi:hypothetical protein
MRCARDRPCFDARSIAVGIPFPLELVLVLVVMVVMLMLSLVVLLVLGVRSSCTRSAWCRPMAHAPSKAFDRGSCCALHCYAR